MSKYISKPQFESLVELSSKVNFRNQELLTSVEDDFADEYKINKIDNLTEEVYRYLLLTSLPFTLSNGEMLTTNWKNRSDCEVCSDVYTIKKALGTGNVKADYFIIGDAPGVGGDFGDFSRAWANGPSSKLLRNALAKIKIYHDCWFSNLLTCALDSNRNSKECEVENCSKFLKHEINRVQPSRIITLGKHTEKLFNKLFELKNVSVYHPSYFLRQGKNYKDYAKHLKEEL